MACTGKELEDRLRDVGKRLASPPTDVGELLSLLDQTEKLLLRVQQRPSQSMLGALRPTRRLLVEKKFLRHPDEDVKVAVALCTSEMTRITTPDAPYDDVLMKEVFQKIVDTFEKLDDISSRSFSKRVSILETVAKVRSRIVMLDLECDALILDMFHIFLRTIRPEHSGNVFSSMGAIMTVVLEESEEISPGLISCLLHAVKNDNKDILPIGRSLGERVITKCALKLKPYLVELAKSKNAFLSKYSKVVASICEEKSDRVEQNNINSAADVMSSERLTQARELDQSIVGVKIRVWWPLESWWYSGIVADYDPMTKMHKILYTDGDVEVLLLKQQRWEFIEDEIKTWFFGGQAKGTMRPDGSEEPPSKKAKKSSNHVVRETNVKTSIKSGTRSSSAGGMELPKCRGISDTREPVRFGDRFDLTDFRPSKKRRKKVNKSRFQAVSMAANKEPKRSPSPLEPVHGASSGDFLSGPAYVPLDPSEPTRIQETAQRLVVEGAGQGGASGSGGVVDEATTGAAKQEAALETPLPKGTKDGQDEAAVLADPTIVPFIHTVHDTPSKDTGCSVQSGVSNATPISVRAPHSSVGGVDMSGLEVGGSESHERTSDAPLHGGLHLEFPFTSLVVTGTTLHEVFRQQFQQAAQDIVNNFLRSLLSGEALICLADFIESSAAVTRAIAGLGVSSDGWVTFCDKVKADIAQMEEHQRALAGVDSLDRAMEEAAAALAKAEKKIIQHDSELEKIRGSLYAFESDIQACRQRRHSILGNVLELDRMMAKLGSQRQNLAVEVQQIDERLGILQQDHECDERAISRGEAKLQRLRSIREQAYARYQAATEARGRAATDQEAIERLRQSICIFAQQI